MKKKYWNAVRSIEEWLARPRAASAEFRFERACPTGVDHGSERVTQELIGWLCRAQDNSRTHDGGVARDYSLVYGWSSSYPETTGYIIPTMLDWAQRTGDRSLEVRARRMLDWLVAIQLPDGAFMGGRIDSMPVVPVTFNTGQILMGLAAGERAFGGYREPMRRAADWLVQSQDPDGCWRRFPTPFASPGVKAYETHVAWGLLEAARVDPGRGYEDAALANVSWALQSVRSNGWIENCSLGRVERPLTHTIGYATRGMLEMYRFGRDRRFLEAARRIAAGVATALRPDGYLPGILTENWTAAADWVCLTGTAQLAHCWLMLFEDTGEPNFADAAHRANAFVRRTVRVEGLPEVRGGVKGSLPYSGDYCRYQYPNWAAKFLADSLMLELDSQQRRQREQAPRAATALQA